MPVTTVAVIYSKNQRKRRRVIVPTSDDLELNVHIAGMHSNEGVFFLPHSDYRTLRGPTSEIPHPEIDGRLNIHLGGPAASDRVAVVGPDNVVKAVICADPSIDVVTDCTLVSCDQCESGWIYDGKGFNPP